MSDSSVPPAQQRRSARPQAKARGRAAALTTAAVMLVTLAAAVGLRLANRGESFSHRVVVGAAGCGAPCDERTARTLADRLGQLGFDAVAPGGLTTPEAVRGFARDHGARLAVMLRLGIEHSAKIDDASQRVGAQVALFVMDSARNDPPRPAYQMRGLEEAKDEPTALGFLSLRLLSGLFPAIGSALLSSEPVRALQQDASGLEQQAAAIALKKHERDVAARAAAMRSYRLHCEQNAELLGAASGRCVSDGCAEEYLVGLLPDGATAVVHDSTDEAVFPLAPDSTAHGFATSERLWLVPRSGPRKLLAEAANFYSRPDLSRDGSTLAFIEQRLEHARLYAQKLGSGERQLVRAVRAPGQLLGARLAPDGARLLYFERNGSGGTALKVAALGGRAEARELLADAVDARFVELAPGGGAPRSLIAALVDVKAAAEATGDGAATHTDLVLLDPASGRELARERALAHRVRAIGDSYRGQLLFGFEDDAGCGFGRFRPGEPIAWYATDLCPKHLAAGRSAVYAHALAGAQDARRQLIRLDPDGGQVELLTKSAQDVQNPRPAPAGGGLAYERVLPREYGELQHVAVCFDER